MALLLSQASHDSVHLESYPRLSMQLLRKRTGVHTGSDGVGVGNGVEDDGIGKK